MALRAARETSDRIGEGLALDNLGVVHHRRGDFDRAERAHRQGLRLAQLTENRDGQCAALLHLVRVALDRQDFPTARQLTAEALDLALDSDVPMRLAQTLNALALVDEASGDETSALTHRRRALAYARRARDASELATTLDGLASHRLRNGFPRLAEAYGRYAAAVVVGITPSGAAPIAEHPRLPVRHEQPPAA